MQRTPAWFAARQGRLTASNLGTAAGVNPYESRQRGLKREAGQIKFTGNEATRHGTSNEPNAIVDYQIRTGNVVKPFSFKVHDSIPWIGGSPDGLVGSKGMIEVKCPFFKQEPHELIPPHYFCQMNGLMEIYNRDWCDFVSWTPANGMNIFRLYRDSETWELLLNKYMTFYAYMKRGCTTMPRQAKGEKDETLRTITESMEVHLDRDFWKMTTTSQLEGVWEGPPEDPAFYSDFNSDTEENDGANQVRKLCRTESSASPTDPPSRALQLV